MIPKAARARLQNIKVSKYLETRRLTEDVFGEECGRKPWRGDTPHAIKPLTMSKIKNYRVFWFPYKSRRGCQIPCENYCALPWFLVTVQNYCGDQLPCNNYRALPWWLATVKSIPWLPITVHQLLCNTVVAVYRGKRYRDEKSLPRKALKISNFCARTDFYVPITIVVPSTRLPHSFKSTSVHPSFIWLDGTIIDISNILVTMYYSSYVGL